MPKRIYNDDEWDLDTAMTNSYNVIVRNFDPFLIITHGRGWFGHDPTGVLDVKDVESVLYYFEDMEDYEKCIELKKVIDEL